MFEKIKAVFKPEIFRFFFLPNFLAPAAPPDVVLFLPSETSEAAELVLPAEGLGLGIRFGGGPLCCNDSKISERIS